MEYVELTRKAFGSTSNGKVVEKPEHLGVS